MRESGLGKSGCNKIVGYTLENSGGPRGAPQIPPLRYAPVGMTILFGNAKYGFQDELSSRPERTRISCHVDWTNGPLISLNKRMRESGLGKSGCNKIVGYTLENSGGPRGAPQIPPLRYAPVGMTILFGNAKYSFQDELSSRPERTRISCHAALDRSACAPFCKGKAHEVRPSDFTNSGAKAHSSHADSK